MLLLNPMKISEQDRRGRGRGERIGPLFDPRSREGGKHLLSSSNHEKLGATLHRCRRAIFEEFCRRLLRNYHEEEKSSSRKETTRASSSTTRMEESRMEESQVPWSDLPPQLWPLIGKNLHTYIDVLRFRSVCRLWRDSLPKVNAIFPLSLPPPLRSRPDPLFHRSKHEVVLFRKIIYRFIPLDQHKSDSPKGWLAKIETTNLADKRFHLPIYSDYQCLSSNQVMEVNFLDFGIEEVGKSYFTELTNFYTTSVSAVDKVVVLPQSACLDVKNCVIVGIDRIGRLAFRKYENARNCWQRIGEHKSLYDDVIMHKGKIYTVNRAGRIFVIDSSMKFIEIAPPMSESGDLKHFVQCRGELYAVDRFVERKACLLDLLNSNSFHIRMWCCSISTANAVNFKVHRLDEEQGRWVEVKDLGNDAFILGTDGFSVSSADVEGSEGNCIYFSHDLRSDLGRAFGTHVFNLEKGSIQKSGLQILKASPIWLDWEPSLPA